MCPEEKRRIWNVKTARRINITQNVSPTRQWRWFYFLYFFSPTTDIPRNDNNAGTTRLNRSFLTLCRQRPSVIHRVPPINQLITISWWSLSSKNYDVASEFGERNDIKRFKKTSLVTNIIIVPTRMKWNYYRWNNNEIPINLFNNTLVFFLSVNRVINIVMCFCNWPTWTILQYERPIFFDFFLIFFDFLMCHTPPLLTLNSTVICSQGKTQRSPVTS